MVSKWLHIDMKIIDPWVLPIWKAVNEAENRGDTTHPGEAASELSLHISTRLSMLPVIVGRIVKGRERLIEEIDSRKARHEWTSKQAGIVFPVPVELQYEILVDVDSLLFEIDACFGLLKRFLKVLHNHVGQKIPKKQIDKMVREIIKGAGHKSRWIKRLNIHRNFFAHEGTPYFAVDLSNAPESYDLLIMKENLREFEDKEKFVRLSELGYIRDGFGHFKGALQAHLISLFS